MNARTSEQAERAGSSGTVVVPGRRRGRRRPTREVVFAVVSPVALLVIWEVLSVTGVIDRRVFSAPSDIARDSWYLLVQGSLLDDTLTTLRRLLLGMALGAIPGVLIGLVMGLSRNVKAVVNPIVAATQALPRIALFPLILLVVGLNENSVIIMVGLGPFFTMLISTMTAVSEVPKIYLKVARSYKMSQLRTSASVVMPAALPVVFGGLRISVGLGLLGVIAVEFLTSQSGLGYMIWHSWQILSLSESMVGLVVAGLMGAALYLIVDWAERISLPYRRGQATSSR
ncbi:taurine ABC transporter permease [Prauserella sp. PE36]|uniref:ABC transporter permease n=1 Tax=Prauserella sp. PE36 TaxID=1504709 RepID=UPI000DE308BE|nr:ABC transporter permease [Prauserella sp. PE36]RBM17709.1 taurine ABC transporter permease [Prauserella sp. PE36]